MILFKRILLFLAILFAFSTIGCSDKSHNNDDDDDEVTIDHIYIASEPTQKEYFLDEPISLDGLKVVAVKSNDAEFDVPNTDLVVSGFLSDKESESVEVSIKYGECSSTFSVEVLPYRVDLESMTLLEYLGQATSIEIPSRINHIGEFAFFQSPITELVVPQSVGSIGIAAFRETKSLQSVDMSKSQVKIIAEELFLESSVGDIKLPEGLETIGIQSFVNATELTTLELPESVVVIKNAAFKGCTKLQSVKIPNYTYRIEENAFAYCENLESVEIYGTRFSEPIQQSSYLGCYAFVGCNKLSRLDIPKSLTTLNSAAASNLPLLKEVTLGENIEELKTMVFNNNFAMTQLTIETPFPPKVTLASYEKPESKTLLPRSVTTIFVTKSAYSRYKTDSVWSFYYDKMIPSL